MTQAISAQGAQFKRAGVLVPEVKTFQGPSARASELDGTSLDSTAKEFVPGLVDYGTFSITMNWIPQNPVHKALKADSDGRVTSAYQLTMPDVAHTTLSFDAFVLEYPKSGGVDAIAEANVTFRVTGPVTETP